MRLVRLAVSLGILAACGPSEPESASKAVVQIFKSPTCGCCVKWADHLESKGFRVETADVRDLAAVKRQHDVPPNAESCHTALVEGYVVEGHVPASDIARLLRERPSVRGLVVPGMPRGSPGMESPNPEPYTVYAFDDDGARTVFARHE